MNKRNPLDTDLSLNSLLVFHEVVKHRSFSKAAEALFISQPAVSRHIRGLELKLGMGLIQKRRGRFALTETGKILFKYTHNISTHLMELTNVLGNLQKDHYSLLKIGTAESYSKNLMPKLLSAFQNFHPSIKIALHLGNAEEIINNLLIYKNDLGLIAATKVPSNFELVPFLKEELILIVSPAHPLAKKEAVSLKELEKCPLIIRVKGSMTREIVLQAFKKMNLHPSFLIEASSSEFIKQWVSEGKGVAIIIKRAVEDEERRGILKTVPILEKLYLKVVFLYLKEAKYNPAIRTFVNFVENQGRKLIDN